MKKIFRVEESMVNLEERFDGRFDKAKQIMIESFQTLPGVGNPRIMAQLFYNNFMKDFTNQVIEDPEDRIIFKKMVINKLKESFM